LTGIPSVARLSLCHSREIAARSPSHQRSSATPHVRVNGDYLGQTGPDSRSFCLVRVPAGEFGPQGEAVVRSCLMHVSTSRSAPPRKRSGKRWFGAPTSNRTRRADVGTSAKTRGQHARRISQAAVKSGLFLIECPVARPAGTMPVCSLQTGRNFKSTTLARHRWISSSPVHGADRPRIERHRPCDRQLFASEGVKSV
jgi:hypothetical protein